MPGARHFFRKDTQDESTVRADIQADIAAARGAQRDLEAAGQHGRAAAMGAAADEYLDELADLKAGRWNPKHC